MYANHVATRARGATAFFAAAVLLVLSPPAAAAQEQTGVLKDESDLQARLVTPSPAAPIRTPTPFVFLSGSREGTEAQIQGGFRLQDRVLGRLYTTLVATAPLSKDETQATVFGDLSGPGAGTTLRLAITGLRWPLEATDQEQTEWCERNKASFNPNYNCDEFDLGDFPQALRNAYKAQFPEVSPLLYEVSGSIQEAEFQYLDPATYQPGSEQHTARSIGASIGRFFGRWLWTAGYRYEVGYDASSPAQICVPLEGGALRCRTAPLGAPARREGSTANFQVRGWFSSKAAWNPRVTYRMYDDEWGVEIPIYFVPDGVDLIGGITPSYNSRDDDWTISLFVGKAFRVGL